MASLFRLLLDVICLQEVHCVSILEDQSWFWHTGYSCAVSPGSNHSSGIIILLRPHISLSHSWPGHSGRSLMVELKVSDNIFRVCSVYAPNRNPDRDRFLTDVATLIDPAVPTPLWGTLIPSLTVLRTAVALAPLIIFVRVPLT